MRIRDQVIEMYLDGYRVEVISDRLEIDLDYVKLCVKNYNKKGVWVNEQRTYVNGSKTRR